MVNAKCTEWAPTTVENETIDRYFIDFFSTFCRISTSSACTGEKFLQNDRLTLYSEFL